MEGFVIVTRGGGVRRARVFAVVVMVVGGVVVSTGLRMGVGGLRWAVRDDVLVSRWWWMGFGGLWSVEWGNWVDVV